MALTMSLFDTPILEVVLPLLLVMFAELIALAFSAHSKPHHRGSSDVKRNEPSLLRRAA